MSKPTRVSLRLLQSASNSPYRRNDSKKQRPKRKERILKSSVLDITTNTTMTDVIEEKNRNSKVTLQNLPDEILLEITKQLNRDDYGFFIVCKSFYHFYDQWVLSIFGGRYEIYYNLASEAPVFLTEERIEWLD